MRSTFFAAIVALVATAAPALANGACAYLGTDGRVTVRTYNSPNVRGMDDEADACIRKGGGYYALRGAVRAKGPSSGGPSKFVDAAARVVWAGPVGLCNDPAVLTAAALRDRARYAPKGGGAGGSCRF